MAKKIGLYFGTFNPIHIGHLIIANYMVEFSDLKEIWFVITPRSPFKVKKSLLDNHHRHQMVLEAIREYPGLQCNTIEFSMPQPNYTIDTLVRLEEKYAAACEFSLLMGEDNLRGFHKWKNHDSILERCEIYVYPRLAPPAGAKTFERHPRIHRLDAPVIEITSSFIRKQHKAGKNIRPMLPEGTWKYMDEMNFYR